MYETRGGFLESLFDMSFTAFITTKIVKLLYILAIVVAVIVWLLLVVGGFNDSPGAGLLGLLLGALFFFIIVIYARVTLELIIVIFRIAEHAAEIADQGRRPASVTIRPDSEESSEST